MNHYHSKLDGYMKDEVVTAQEIMTALGISRTTLWRWEQDGRLPKRMGMNEAKVLWSRKQIKEWLKTMKMSTDIF